jgi:protein gp37
MGKESGIAWTNGTFNPWWGCVEVSPACDNCYARTWDARFADEGQAHWGRDQPRRFFGDKHWNEPRRWNRSAEKSGERFLVFCASMSDVFESGRDDLDAQRERLWQLIQETPALTWLLLTKRPQNVSRMLPPRLVGAPNIWHGTTLESPAYTWRVEAMLAGVQRHAPVRFVSIEPCLEQVTMRAHLGMSRVNWCITGCESGDGARFTPTDWYRKLRDESVAAGVPFLFKQAPLDAAGIGEGAGSFRKRDLRTGTDGIKRVHWIVEKPYLDGEQWMQFPAHQARGEGES